MISVIIGVAGVVVLLGFSIMIHEFGHFITAKMSGVPVDEFAIGLGPALWKKRVGETQYSINWIPFGGFVRMQGVLPDEEETVSGNETAADREPEQDRSQKDQLETTEEAKDKKSVVKDSIGDDPMADMAALRNKPYPIKIMIFAAGVFFNFLTAAVIFSFIFFSGIKTPLPMDAVIGPVPEDSRLGEMGVEQGDRVLSIAGNDMENWEDILTELGKQAQKDPDASVRATLQHPDGKTYEISLPSASREENREVYRYFNAPYKSYLAFVIPSKPAHRAGLKKGDYIVSINGTPIEYAVELLREIEKHPLETITVTYKRDGEKMTTEVTPKPSPTDPDKGWIGVHINMNDKFDVEQYGLAKSFSKGFSTAFNTMISLPGLIVHEFSKGIPNIRENVGGPVAIIYHTYHFAQMGAQEYFRLFAMINLILAIMNLLPIPILDGGHIMFATIEAVARRPIPEQVLMPIYTVFFFLIISLFILITFNDILMIWF